MSFVQWKTVHGLGEYRASPSVELPSLGILDKGMFYRALEEVGWERAWLARRQGFPIRQAGLTF